MPAKAPERETLDPKIVGECSRKVSQERLSLAHCFKREGLKMNTPHEDALLTREATATALTAAGYPITRATLATMAVRSGGPAFHRFGKYVVYRWSTTLAWAQSRLSAPMRSTSEQVVSP
jgi:hypothetical protein